VTAQAGLQIIEAAQALREHDLQLMTTIEIGNMTLGAGACCHTKDALDGIEFGQVSSYITRIKWVTPSGDLAEASEADSPDLLRLVRSSQGMCGIIYEVSLRVKPIEALHFSYLPRAVDELTQAEVDTLLDSSEGLICWTLGRTCVFQQRHRVHDAGIFGSLAAAARRKLWNFGDAHVGHVIDQFVKDKTLATTRKLSTSTSRRFCTPHCICSAASPSWRPTRSSTIATHRPRPNMRLPSGHFRVPQWLSTLRAYID
jgi:FAD/FMN-containing dehydrogenase